jgi:NADH-quinone oxidoreductase subunit N
MIHSAVIQSIDYAAISPPLIVTVAALAVLVADLFLPASRTRLLPWIGFAGVAAALVALAGLRGGSRRTFCVPAAGDLLPSCSYVVNDLTLVFQLIALAGAAVVILLSADTVTSSRLPAGEYYFLLLCSVAGAVTLAAARDLVTLVVALEVVSLPAFALVGLRRYDGRSSEAALKFFLVSVVSTAVMLYGISLVYGVTGAVHLDRVATALGEHAHGPSRPVAAVGVALTLVGFAFKVSAVPFHFWAPDTYSGAPIPIAAYLSVVSKAAGFVGIILVVSLGFRPYADVWGPLIAVLAAVTMTVGNLVALRQREAVRLLAWSSVAQAGYMLVPLGVATVKNPRGGDALGEALSATAAYLLVYGVVNLGAFAVVTLVARHRSANLLADYRGLFRTEPVIALALAFFLLCLAGLPPGLIGLFAKVVVFRAAVDGGLGWLAVVMAVNVVIALYYYLVWAAGMFGQAEADVPEGEPPSFQVPPEAGLAVGLMLGTAVVLSFAPQVVLQVLSGSGPLIR